MAEMETKGNPPHAGGWVVVAPEAPSPPSLLTRFLPAQGSEPSVWLRVFLCLSQKWEKCGDAEKRSWSLRHEGLCFKRAGAPTFQGLHEPAVGGPPFRAGACTAPTPPRPAHSCSSRRTHRLHILPWRRWEKISEASLNFLGGRKKLVWSSFRRLLGLIRSC